MDSQEIWHASLFVNAGIITLLGLSLLCYFPQSRRYPGLAFLWLFLCAGISKTNGYLLLLVLPPSSHTVLSAADKILCHTHQNFFHVALFWTGEFFAAASAVWYIILTLDVANSVANPFLHYKTNEIAQHATAWSIAAIYLILMRFVCSPWLCPTTSYGVIFHLPRYTALFLISFISLWTWQQSGRLQVRAHYTTRRVSIMCLRYTGVFGVTSILVSFSELNSDAAVLAQMVESIELILTFAFVLWDMRIFERPESPDDDSPCAVLRRDILKYTSIGILLALSKKSVCGYRMEKFNLTVTGMKTIFQLSFYDVAPKLFATLRRAAGITTTAYAEAFAQKDLTEGGPDRHNNSLLYATGKYLIPSMIQAFFKFFTANSKFLVKTISESEFNTLLLILPHYYQYILANPGSLLCRIWGCHSITLPVGTRRMYFIVLKNVFAETRVQQRFELKGNIDGRQTLRPREVSGRKLSASRRGSSVDELMLDIDFLTLHRGLFCLSQKKIEELRRQMVQDCLFLSSQNIMGYSLLMGVHATRKHPAQNRNGGYRWSSTDGKREYALEVVDILQQYTWSRKLQRFVLGYLACKNFHDINAMPPHAYARRLIRFVFQRLAAEET